MGIEEAVGELARSRKDIGWLSAHVYEGRSVFDWWKRYEDS